MSTAPPVVLAETAPATRPREFKVGILNIGQYVKAAQFSEFLRENAVRLGGPLDKRQWSHAGFVVCESEEAQVATIAALKPLVWRGKKLVIKTFGDEEDAAAQPSEAQNASSAQGAKRKRSGSIEGDRATAGSGDEASAVTAPRDVNDVVTPWREVPYSAQLARKEELIATTLRAIVLRIRAHTLRKAGIKWLDRHAAKALKQLSEAEAVKPASGEVTDAAKVQTPTDASSSKPEKSTTDEVDEADHSCAGKTATAEAAVGNGNADPSATGGAGDSDTTQRYWRSIITRNLPEDVAGRLPAWLVSAAAVNDGQACPVLPIVASPDVTGYRNKAVFTIGRDAEGQPCVGSRISSFAEGCTVARPDGAVHLPAAILDIAAAVNEFVRSSPLPPYDLVLHGGVWRSVTVRWSPSRGEAMVIVLLQPTGVPDAPATADAPAASAASEPEGPSDPHAPFPPSAASELARLCEKLSAAPLRVVSVFAQSYGGLSQPPPNHPHTLLSGRPTITEELCGMRFNVSPGAFFQVNSGAAALLYGLVRDLAIRGAGGFPRASRGPLPAAMVEASGTDVSGAAVALTSDAAAHEEPDARNLAVLDVCCGTGTIGIVCSPLAARVVGVELSEDAIADAIVNARLNAVPNASFVCARAEDVMPRLLSLVSKLPGESAGGPANVSVLQAKDDVAPSAELLTEATALTSESTGITRVVAILDPPRGGVHMDVIKALRTCRLIKRIVYVSCNPTGSFVEDAVRFCAPQEERSGFARGPAFRMVASVPVDLFPHTPHTELVTLFERD